MDPVNLYDMEALAKQTMSHNMWTFVDAASNDEITKRRNRDSFDRILVNARFLTDVANRDISTTVLGEKIDFPVMIAPTGGQRQAHPEGERATATGAGRAGTLYTLPTSSGYSIEEVSEVATGPLWFQLYHQDDEVTEILVKRAKQAGYKAICLTIDTPGRQSQGARRSQPVSGAARPPLGQPARQARPHQPQKRWRPRPCGLGAAGLRRPHMEQAGLAARPDRPAPDHQGHPHR